MEGESEKYPGLKELPFDLSMLTDREQHDGFFAVVFTKAGLCQSHWDKMDGMKFGRAMEVFIKVALANTPKNADLIIAMMQDFKAEMIEKGFWPIEPTVVEGEEPAAGPSAGPPDTMPVADESPVEGKPATESGDKQEVKQV